MYLDSTGGAAVLADITHNATATAALVVQNITVALHSRTGSSHRGGI
jgi:hypothetical protein